MIRTFFGLCLSFILLSPAARAEEAKIAILGALDKVTARVSQIDVHQGLEIDYGSLLITMQRCEKSAPEDPPEVKMFLRIDELRPGDTERTEIFRGWMFASSPAVSAMEHPVYDIWVIDCKTASVEKSAPAESKAAD
jgi:hypothetical protein